MSTSWSFIGDPVGPEAESNYTSLVSFDLFSYRHIKQVKISEDLA